MRGPFLLTAVRESRRTYGWPAAQTSDQRPATSDQHSTSDQRLATSDYLGTNNEQPTTKTLPPLSEVTLSTLWSGQRFPAAALATRDGAPVSVLHPGLAGRGAGPDFRDAIIGFPHGVARGDVELHVRASDFRAHGHARDPRYNHVVLHVVFHDDASEDTLLACGRRAPVVALAPWVERRARELSDWLAAPRLWREPCHNAVARLGDERVGQVLDELGELRFRERASNIGEQIALRGPPAALLGALIEGLGYGGQRALMAELAAQARVENIAAALDSSDPAPVEAALLQAAGSGMTARIGRPANSPAQRIKGLAALLVRQRALFGEVPDVAALLALPCRELIAAFSAPPLIGRSRAIELLTNAVLPWAAALASCQKRLEVEARACALYGELPRPARYGALAFLEQDLRDGPKALPLTAQRQQGLLALYKAECSQGGCGRCVLSR